MQQTRRKAAGVNVGPCRHSGCARKAWCKGWCQLHYCRDLYGTDMDAPLPTRNKGRDCRIGWCAKPAMSHGLCEMHYARSLRGSDMDKPPNHRNKGEACSMDGCEKPSSARGLCHMHYTRLVRHGDPLAVFKPGSPRGPANPCWKGDNVGYRTVHDRLRTARGSASSFQCQCGRPALHWALNTTRAQMVSIGPENLPFSTDLSDYDPLCVPCHKRGDLARGSVKDAADAQEGKRRRRIP